MESSLTAPLPSYAGRTARMLPAAAGPCSEIVVTRWVASSAIRACRKTQVDTFVFSRALRRWRWMEDVDGGWLGNAVGATPSTAPMPSPTHPAASSGTARARATRPSASTGSSCRRSAVCPPKSARTCSANGRRAPISATAGSRRRASRAWPGSWLLTSLPTQLLFPTLSAPISSCATCARGRHLAFLRPGARGHPRLSRPSRARRRPSPASRRASSPARDTRRRRP